MRNAPLSRPEKSAADYLAMAVGPLLIMLMVGSLIFFLIEVIYRGDFPGRVRWILFWFTVASVLVSRISIEQGKTYGAVYGLALGLATAFRITQLIGMHLGALLFLGLTWWCASKLVWDCTLIDEDDDASGEGLWDKTGLEKSRGGEADSASPERKAETPTTPASAPQSAPEKRPHAPGLWIIYFSLGALPVFAIGQLMIPSGDTAARTQAFLLLLIYVGSALGLLLSTSFLGLRRYLRQRHLVMPASMARSWITRGCALILGVMLAALFLPRPQGADTLVHLAGRVLSREQQASRFATTRGEAAEGEGRRIGEGEGEGEGSAQRRRSPGVEADAEEVSGAVGNGENDAGQGAGSEAGGEEAGARNDDHTASPGDDRGEQGRGSSQRVANQPPSLPQADLSWVRWLMLAAGLMVAGMLILRFGRDWLDAWRKRAPKKPKAGPSPSAPRAARSFREFQNPFRTGAAQRMSARELVAYTFEALEAWGADHGCRRTEETTPAEFGRELAKAFPEISDDVLDTVRVYIRVAYGGWAPSAEDLAVVERLWSALERAAVPMANR